LFQQLYFLLSMVKSGMLVSGSSLDPYLNQLDGFGN